MKIKLIAMFLVFLMIHSSFVIAYDPFEKIESGLEDAAGDLSTFEATDIIINVDSYQPTVLQEQAFESDQPGGYPLVATLTGIKTNPVMDLHKIRKMNVRPDGNSREYVSSIYYKPPRYGYFDLNNLGYLVIRLKNLKEDDVPERLDINMTADIYFEIQNGFGITEQDFLLPVLDENEFLNRKSEFGFYGGRGYIRLNDIKGDSANLIVYDGSLSKNSFSVKEGTPSSKKSLSGGVPYLFYREEEDLTTQRNIKNTYRVRVNYITGNKDKAKVEMFYNGEYKLKELVEGQPIYGGSDWEVKDIKITNSYDEVELVNKETKEKKILKGGKFYVPPEEKNKGFDEDKFTEFPEFNSFGDLIFKESKGVDPLLVAAMIKQESGFNSNEVSEKGAIGLMQILPSTGEDIAKELKLDVEDINKHLLIPENNVKFGVYYLKQKLTKYGDNERLALAAYNGGDGANEMSQEENCEGQRIWECEGNEGYKETRDYVKDIIDKHYPNYKTIFYGEEIVEEEKDNDEKIKEDLDLIYKGIEKELDDLIIKKPNNFEEVAVVLGKYSEFLNNVKSYRNLNLFNEYKGFLLNKDFPKLDQAYRDNEVISKGITNYFANNFQLDFVFEVKESEKKSEKGSSEDYFLNAIKEYSEVVEKFNGEFYPPDGEEQENVAMEAQLRIAEIYDKDLRDDNQAVKEYRKLITSFDYGEKGVIENRIHFLETVSLKYNSDTVNIDEDNNVIQITLYGVEKASSDSKAKISVDGMPKVYSIYSYENKEVSSKLEGSDWHVKEVNADNVLIVKLVKNSNTNALEESSPTRLYQGKEVRDLKDNDGTQHIFLLEDVDIEQQAHVTILPGEETLTTKSNFMLHVPVEPRLWKLSTEQMNDHINFTNKAIDTLNGYIDTIENVYKWWSISCYSTFAILWIKNIVWFGSKGRNLARKEVMSSWKEDCEFAVKAEEYSNVFDCIKAKRGDIDDDLDTAEKIYNEKYGKDANVYNERIKNLAQGDQFKNSKLNQKYDEEVFDILLEEKMILPSNYDALSTEEKLQKNREASLKAHQQLLGEEKSLRENYGFEEDYFKSIKTTVEGKNEKPTSPDDGKERTPISKSQVTEIDTKWYYYVGNTPYLVKDYEEIKKEGVGTDYYTGYYLDNKGGKHYFETVPDEVKTEPNEEKVVSLLNIGKCKNKVDKLSVDAVAYLRVSRRGSDCLPIEVELWERYSEFGSQGLPLNTESAYMRMSAFSLEQCRKGSTSDRIDVLSSLKKDHKNLEGACRDLIEVDRASGLQGKKIGENIKDYMIQSAVQETGGLQCFDIMDIGDCLTLFSVCDPVMCPASGFNAGGKWNVDNVVSTGIFGSIFLGSKLWDFKRVPPEVGVCVPGIDAGLKNYRSLLEGYQECLIARRDKGENVGICDTIRNVGVCKILWREGAAFFRVGGGVLDNLLGGVDKAAGGGEYGFFQSNIQKTGDFLNFFTKEYATTYFSAYRGASTDEIGEELCKAAIYGKVPGRGSLLDQLTKPEGPVQFIGWFTDMPHSDVAGELTSDYEVYYHIYAGEDRERVRYQIYLKDLDDLAKRLYVTKSTKYLERGDFIDETWRSSGPAGYDELCMVIDYQEHCGFGRVSSDILFDYLEDKKLQKSVETENIKNERECIGDPTVFTNPSVGSAVDALYPNIGRSGLVRVCSSEDPGKGVDADGWKSVGTCGNNSLGQSLGSCWVNKQSYLDALSEYDTQRRNDVEKLFREISEGLVNDDEIMIQIETLIGERGLNKNDKDKLLGIVSSFTVLEGQTITLLGKLNYEIGETYYIIAKLLHDEEAAKIAALAPLITEGADETRDITLAFKVELVGEGLFGWKPNYDYVWNGEYWEGEFLEDRKTGKSVGDDMPDWEESYTVLVKKKINDYEMGLNEIVKVMDYKKITKLRLYCDHNENANFDEDVESSGAKNWIKNKANECLKLNEEGEISGESGSCEIEYDDRVSLLFITISRPMTSNLYFKYNNGNWYWNCKDCLTKSEYKKWTNVDSNYGLEDMKDASKKAVLDLRDAESFNKGVEILVELAKDGEDYLKIHSNVGKNEKDTTIHYKDIEDDGVEATVNKIKNVCGLAVEESEISDGGIEGPGCCTRFLLPEDGFFGSISKSNCVSDQKSCENSGISWMDKGFCENDKCVLKTNPSDLGVYYNEQGEIFVLFNVDSTGMAQGYSEESFDNMFLAEYDKYQQSNPTVGMVVGSKKLIINVEGYASIEGNRDANMELSKRRAQHIKELIIKILNEKRKNADVEVNIVFKGPTQAFGEGSNNYVSNRRVVVKFGYESSEKSDFSEAVEDVIDKAAKNIQKDAEDAKESVSVSDKKEDIEDIKKKTDNLIVLSTTALLSEELSDEDKEKILHNFLEVGGSLEELNENLEGDNNIPNSQKEDMKDSKDKVDEVIEKGSGDGGKDKNDVVEKAIPVVEDGLEDVEKNLNEGEGEKAVEDAQTVKDFEEVISCDVGVDDGKKEEIKSVVEYSRVRIESGGKTEEFTQEVVEIYEEPSSCAVGDIAGGKNVLILVDMSIDHIDKIQIKDAVENYYEKNEEDENIYLSITSGTAQFYADESGWEDLLKTIFTLPAGGFNIVHYRGAIEEARDHFNDKNFDVYVLVAGRSKNLIETEIYNYGRIFNPEFSEEANEIITSKVNKFVLYSEEKIDSPDSHPYYFREFKGVIGDLSLSEDLGEQKITVEVNLGSNNEVEGDVKAVGESVEVEGGEVVDVNTGVTELVIDSQDEISDANVCDDTSCSLIEEENIYIEDEGQVIKILDHDFDEATPTGDENKVQVKIPVMPVGEIYTVTPETNSEKLKDNKAEVEDEVNSLEITDESGEPVVGVEVQIDQGNGVETLKTDIKGKVDLKKPKCESTFQGYECVDTTKYGCDSEIQKYYCPQYAEEYILCCKKGNLLLNSDSSSYRLNQMMNGYTGYVDKVLCSGVNCAKFVTRAFEYAFGYGRHFITGVGGNAWNTPKNIGERKGEVQWFDWRNGDVFTDYNNLNPGDIIGFHYTVSDFRPDILYQSVDEQRSTFGWERGNTIDIDFTHLALYLGKKNNEPYITHLYHVPNNLKNPQDNQGEIRVEPLNSFLELYGNYFKIRVIMKPNRELLYQSVPNYEISDYVVEQKDIENKNFEILINIAKLSKGLFGDEEEIAWVIADYNKIVDDSQISIGDNLKIPLMDETASTNIFIDDPLYDSMVESLKEQGISTEWADLIYKHSTYKSPEYFALVMAIIEKESHFSENAVSRLSKNSWTTSFGEFIGEQMASDPSLGCTQVKFSKAIEINNEEGWGYTNKEVKKQLKTKDGCVKFGVVYLDKSIIAYAGHPSRLNSDNIQYIIADYNGGHYSSRNAAFQKRVADLSGKDLTLDGDLLRYEGVDASKQISQTEYFIREVLGNRISAIDIRKDILKEKSNEFENTFVYKEVNKFWLSIYGDNNFKYAIIPDISKSSGSTSTVQEYLAHTLVYYNSFYDYF